MATRYKVTVTPKDGTEAGWHIEYFRWVSYNDPAPEIHRITRWAANEGKFSASIDLEDGTYGLTCQAVMSGRKVEVNLDPQPPITQPSGSKWPFKVEVPSTATQVLRVRYFKVGA